MSFIPVASLFALLVILRPMPLPARDDIAGIRWYMLMAGLVGVLAVFNGLLITANLVTAIVLDHFGWLGMKRTRTTKLRLGGVVVTVIGIMLIASGKA